MNNIYKLSRDVTQKECSWLPRTLEKGETVYLYTGPTYGAVGSGIPITEKPDELPFLEIPADALEFAKPNFENFCKNFCVYKHQDKRNEEPCINCPAETWADMMEDEKNERYY